MHRTHPPAGGTSRSDVAIAFRELHGRRLHGFALLLTLGDRAHAADLAAEALNAAMPKVAELRHPERAAAWLRAHCLHRVRRASPVTPRRSATATRVLAELGVDERTFAGLAALDRRERAALVAASVERLDSRDVGTVVGRQGVALDRLLSRARARYAAAFAATSPPGGPDGPTVDRIRATAQRAMA